MREASEEYTSAFANAFRNYGDQMVTLNNIESSYGEDGFTKLTKERKKKVKIKKFNDAIISSLEL